jgi:hypothetical protein
MSDNGAVLRSDDPDVDALLAEHREAGWLYAIVAPEAKRVKIGHARDVSARALLFQTGSPVVLYLHSATFHLSCHHAEADAHRRLAHARTHGEWFDLQDDQVDGWLAARESDVAANGLWDRYTT